MRSMASFKGHPLHPMLIAFPLTFFISALVCDVMGRVAGSPAWWRTGAYLALAGIISAVAAAVPGLIDYLYVVPPRSSGKRRATWHMLANLSVVVLFAAAWILRGGTATPPDAVVLALEAGAMVLLSAGGWMGGTLVYRNRIGVEHRYARAGKWKETRVECFPGQPVAVASADELEPDQMKLIRMGDRRIALARTKDGYIAFDDRCSHRGGSLADGVMMCDKVQCLWHGSQFNVRSGAVEAGPAKDAIRTYPVSEKDGKVMVTVPKEK